jgi:hypothetical protein
MTQKFKEFLYPPEQDIPPLQYTNMPPSVPLPPGGDYIQEQYGGGRRHESPPVELTPTRLRSMIKTTQRDIGVVREAAIRRQGTQLSSDAPVDALVHSETVHPIHDASVAGGKASSSSLPSSKSRHTSPSYSHDPLPPRPAALQDMFYDPMDAQTWLTQNSDGFEMVDDGSFTAMLMDAQDHFLTSPTYSNQQSIVEGKSSHQETVLASVTTNIIPPTPLKNASSNSGVTDTHLHNREQGMSESIGGDRNHDDVPASTSAEPFVSGRKSDDANAILDAGFIDIEQSFIRLARSTAMPIQQVINCFLKSRGRMTVQTNFWNIYARSYFKDNVEQELARVGVTLPADGGSPSEL